MNLFKFEKLAFYNASFFVKLYFLKLDDIINLRERDVDEEKS